MIIHIRVNICFFCHVKQTIFVATISGIVRQHSLMLIALLKLILTNLLKFITLKNLRLEVHLVDL